MANKNAKDMKSFILDSATELMTEKGLKETSLSNIAKKAGISKGTLYYYYSAKEDIIYDIADRNLTQITEEMLSILNNKSENVSRRDILKTLIEKVLGAETRSRLHLYLLNEVSNTNALADKFKIRYESWRKTLEEAAIKLMPEGKNCATLATLILATLDGLVIQKLCGYNNIPVDDIVDLILQTS